MLFQRNQQKNKQHKGTEHVNNINQKIWILGKKAPYNQPRISVLPAKNIVQTITGFVTLPEKHISSSTDFTKVGVDHIRPSERLDERSGEQAQSNGAVLLQVYIRDQNIKVVPKLDIDSWSQCNEDSLQEGANQEQWISRVRCIQRDKLCKLREVRRERSGMEQRRDRRKSDSTGDVMELLPTAATNFERNCERLVISCREQHMQCLGTGQTATKCLSRKRH